MDNVLIVKYVINVTTKLEYNVLQLGDVWRIKEMNFQFMTDFTSTKRPLSKDQNPTYYLSAVCDGFLLYDNED
jgi:hypothetical protein